MKLTLSFYSPNWDKTDIKDIYGEANMDGVVEWDGKKLTGPQGFIDMVLNMTRGRHRSDRAMIEEAMRFAPFRIRNAYRWCELEGAEPEVPDVPPWERWKELADEDAEAAAAEEEAAESDSRAGSEVTLRPYPPQPDPTEGQNEFTLVDSEGCIAAEVILDGDAVISIEGPQAEWVRGVVGVERVVMGNGGEGIDEEGNVVLLYDGQVTLAPMSRANFAELWAAPGQLGFQRGRDAETTAE